VPHYGNWDNLKAGDTIRRCAVCCHSCAVVWFGLLGTVCC